MIEYLDRKNLEEIETKLKNYKYNQIPKKFIFTVDSNFESFSYLKSLLEMKKEED